MKHIKKLLSILMVLTLVLSLGVTAFAAPAVPQNTEVTLPDEYNTHTMVAYKIFEGSQNTGSAGNQLGITDWAAGVDQTGLLTALAVAYPDAGFVATGMKAVDAAKAISDMGINSNTDAAVAFSKIVAAHVAKSGTVTFEGTPRKATLSSGYWIIVDETTFTDENPQPTDWSWSSYLLEVVGEGTLTLAKKVDIPEVEKKVDNVDSVVGDLNQPHTFTLTASLPENYADYETYFVAFHDTMEHGLTLDPNSFTLTVKDGDGTDYYVEGNLELTLSTPGSVEQTIFTYTIKNLKEAIPGLTKDSKIVLSYTASIDEDAIVRNVNDVYLEYSNKPFDTGEGHGNTPPDTVVVFTFFVDGTKVKPGAEEGKFEPLEGASFTLYKSDTEDGEESVYRPEVSALKNEESGNYEFAFGKLGEGYYRLEETKVPNGFNKADDIIFRVRSEKDGNGNVTKAVVEQQVMDEGRLVWKEVTSAAIQIDGPTDTEGHIPEQVINRTGLELPETGGIGTTIFYVIGAVLVAAAVVLLVTKKRMSGADK